MPASTSTRSAWTPVIAFPFVSFLNQWFQRSRNGASPPSAEFASVEALKLAVSLLVCLRDRHLGKVVRAVQTNGYAPADEELLLDDRNAESDEAQVSDGSDAGSAPPIYATASVAAIWAAYLYLFQFALGSLDAATARLSLALSTPLTIYATYALFAHSPTPFLWQVVALQLSGLCLAKNGLFSFLFPSSSIICILALPLTNALRLVSINIIYHLHGSASHNTCNIILFSAGLCIHVSVLSAYYIFPSPSISQSLSQHLSLHFVSSIIFGALEDIIVLSLISHFDAAFENILASLNLGVLFLAVALYAQVVSLGVLLGFALTLWASISYILGRNSNQIPDLLSSPGGRRIVAAIPFAALATASAIAIIIIAPLRSTESLSHSDIFTLSQELSCIRRPLVARLEPTMRQYRHFDNVLLVVFFSHPRYDVNLDYYERTYAEYFPNMVFVGPASREDAGFNHSYDVIVDSYGSAENLTNPEFYQMAGRMAHHMLFTVMKDHPCYHGYLWAPFDTLLNVPRLQQFDQNRFWYHSPFGEYVPNSALESDQDPDLHAPPARISPDPALNLTEDWKGWGPDWWWGDPHVGLPACLPAFRKAPSSQHRRLASFFENGTERFLGGSSDTLYVPGIHREAFLETLALFLETECFMEIALPTTVHLVVPPSERILFVDHWWIWQPPFNATFVRMKWEEGFEVDTFHTFHWGDAAEGESWRAHPENIEDVRELLQESARRQGVRLPVATSQVTGRSPTASSLLPVDQRQA